MYVRKVGRGHLLLPSDPDSKGGPLADWPFLCGDTAAQMFISWGLAMG